VTDDGAERATSRVRATARSINNNPGLVNVARRARQLLPGDSDFGDRLSVSGSSQPALAGRAVAAMTDDHPGFLREAGLGALQVWQALLETSGRGQGDRELTIVFTDLVDFSSWSLHAGDDETLQLLREVSECIEPPVVRRRGRVVKRLGDGMMAVFTRPQAAYDAVLEARESLESIEIDGYTPRLRAGIHTGRPKKIGDDYVGVDVNVAARLAEKANAGEVLMSEAALRELDPDSVTYRRKKTFAFMRVKGVPTDMAVYAVAPR
jgi:adenylate cyclase